MLYLGLQPAYLGAALTTGTTDSASCCYTFAHREPIPVDSIITDISFYASHERAVKFWLLRPDTPGSFTTLTPAEGMSLTGDDVIVGVNKVK